MRAVRVDFAPAPAWRRWAWSGAIVLSWTFTCTTGWHAWQEWRALQMLNGTFQQARVQQAKQALREKELQAELAKPKPYAKDAAEAVRIASFPTDQVLHALETTQIEGVRVTLIDLNPGSAKARVELEFVEVGQLMKYVEQINEGDERARWNLIQFKTSKTGMAAYGGTAVLSSDWH